MAKSVIQLLAEEVLRTGKEIDLDFSRPPRTVYTTEQARKWFSCHKGSVSCQKYISDYARNVKDCDTFEEAERFFDKEKAK